MRKFLLLLLLFCLLLPTSLLACKDEEVDPYPPVARTADESRVVMKVGSYDVYYDQFRALYLQYKNLYGEDDAAIKAALTADLVEFYALFSLAEKKGIDVWGETMNKAVVAGVKRLIEGDVEFAGYGSYENYKKSIKESGMTDATVRLQLRADAVRAELLHRLKNDGTVKSDDETLAAFLLSDDCVRVQYIYVEESAYYYKGSFDELAYSATLEAASTALLDTTDDNFVLQMTKYAPTMNRAVDQYISRYSIDAPYTGVGDAAFSLTVGGTQAISYGSLGRVYFLRRAESAAFADVDREVLAAVYDTHALGELIAAEGETMTVTTTELYNSVTPETVK